MITENLMIGLDRYTIRIGQNKQENWKLLDNSQPNNIWFHLIDRPSPYVVLDTSSNINQIPRNVLHRCGILCKMRSSSRSENNCFVHYNYVKMVRKGEFVGEAYIDNGKTLRV